MQKNGNTIKHLDFIIIDLLCIELSFFAAFKMRLSQPEEVYYGSYYKMMDFIIVLAYFLLLFFKDSHSNILRRNIFKELKNVVFLNTILIGVIIVGLFFIKQSTTYSRIIFGLFYIYDVVLMFAVRALWKQFLLNKFKTSDNGVGVLIVTYKAYVDEFIEAVMSKNNGYFKIKGILLLDGNPKEDKGTEHNGIVQICRSELLEFLKSNVVDEAYILAKKNESGRLANDFLTMGITAHISINMVLDNLPNATIGHANNFLIITSSIDPINLGQQIIKRIVDIICSVFGLILVGLTYVVIAPIVKKQSPGPVFFKQERVGKNGRRFMMYKFRSMYMDAEERKKELMDQNEMQGLMFKMDDDPRIMPIGKFIRKTSIDELPQFWNILKGEMSLVGTRPPTVDEYEQYERHHLSRLALKPGLTGMWQVSGRSDITDFEEVVRLDNEYIRNFSVWLDIKIILKTFATVFKMEGSK